jgi:hypothetical protein
MNGRSLSGAGVEGRNLFVLALLLHVVCDGFAAEVACGREERGRRPQDRQSSRMDEFLAQEARRASLDQPGDIRWKRRRQGAHTQVNLIGLNRQFDQSSYRKKTAQKEELRSM